ncbi:cryptochrome/photolyase family protein [Actinacidiphila guanduensis]|uniref:Deoxyribodipyrimidine photo-lyase type I n=1 Tax=Actinacidiphila guanduensis TaxID=310781 RepID=A0A1H0HM66_9ACTN|nr:deoxyribodipyrimidine photo-lyase [Actinacidiphila guanduensis]SDO20154.1 deoxyribodipyrimidine photo-lyase type I [Actinacidiphila guanduensis]
MTTSLVLFTADLRLHDHPPLRAALDEADEIVPLFVRDPAVDAAGFAAPNRLAFLHDCLADLDAALRERGGRLVLRSGDTVEQVREVAATADARTVHVAAGTSAFARRREERLRTALAADRRRLDVHDEVVTALAPGAVTPGSTGHFAVFTPYFRRWSAERLRTPGRAPQAVRVPDAIGSEPLPSRAGVPGTSPGLAAGGERVARARLASWLRSSADAYERRHDDLAADGTSRLSPHLHFGTLSPVEAVHRARARGGPGAEAFVRQLAWRDFHQQVLAARPDAARADYRPRHDRWRTGAAAREDLAAWRDGRTGYPIVDAAMRQLREEGWMHNRGRLLAASFLTKTLYLDWRHGARHFLDLLVDGDVAANQLNWQWVAGTGTDTRPNRVLNPLRQALRYDPEGAYVRRHVPELAAVRGSAVHRPWTLPAPERDRLDYPAPIADLAEASARFRAARGLP